MKNIKYLISIASLVFNTTLNAQSWLWARTGNTTANANASSVIVSNSGTIYIKGGYGGILALDSVSLNAGSTSNGFIASCSNAGIFLKGTKIIPVLGSQGTQGSFSMNSLNNDEDDNVYLTGQINENIIFDTISTNSLFSGYLVKFNSNLNGLSVKYASDIVYSSGFDNEKSMYLVGTIERSVNYIDTFTLYNSNPQPIFNPKMFLAKLDSTGKCKWVKQSWGGSGGSSLLKLYQNSIYIYGVVDSCFLFDTITICNTNSAGSGFLAKINTEGNVIWAKNYTVAGLAFFSAMDIDNSGNCYVAGWLDSTIHLGNDTLYKTPGSNRNTFLAKYDSLGAVVWARHIDCTGDMLCKSIATDNIGNTYLTGNFSGNATFGNDVILAQSSSDGYITRFDKNGNCLGGKTIGNVTSNSIAQDADGNAIVTGNLSTGTTYFDSIPLTCTGQSNFFLAKLEAITGSTNSVRMRRLDDRLVIYANPNTGSFTIEVPQGIVRGNRAQLGIYNSTGGVVTDEAVDISNNRLSIDIGSVQKGIYSVTLSSGQRRYTGRVVVE